VTHLGYEGPQNSAWTWRGRSVFNSCHKWNADAFPLTMHNENCLALVGLTEVKGMGQSW